MTADRKRPLRSVLIGDVDHYPSEYVFGVNQAMTLAGHWHTTVNVRLDLGAISKRVREMQPDVIWGHMLLWAPGENKTYDLLCFLAEWRAAHGAKVFLHDGDARAETRFPTDISEAVDVALCNHTASRRIWNVQQLHWPYFAFYQKEIAQPVPEYMCDLAFAGRLDGGGLYQARTELVLGLQAKLGDRMRVVRLNTGQQMRIKEQAKEITQLRTALAALPGEGMVSVPEEPDDH